MSFIEPVSSLAAFGAGILSFFSPCILPLIPAYFSFISGVSMEELNQGPTEASKLKIKIASLSFIAGFSLVFIMLGASASFLGQIFSSKGEWIRIGGGLLIIIFGLHLGGILKIPLFNKEKRLHIKSDSLHGLAAFFIGMAFAAGWSPCIGPLLGSILFMAGTKESLWQGVYLLSVYASGLALPFLFLAFTASQLMSFIKKAKLFLRVANISAAIFLIITGLLLMSNQMQNLNFSF